MQDRTTNIFLPKSQERYIVGVTAEAQTGHGTFETSLEREQVPETMSVSISHDLRITSSFFLPGLFLSVHFDRYEICRTY